MNITTIIFDLGNVILTFDSAKISQFIASKSGYPREEVHGFVFGSELEKSLDSGQITLEQLLDSVNKKFSSDISINEFYPVWCDMFTQNDGIEGIIRGLKGNKYRLGMLSNTNKPQFEFVKNKFPAVNLFDDYHLSFETGLLKPEAKTFKEVIAFYGGEPASLVFIDDLEANVEAARRAGIVALRYVSSQKLLSELTSLGLKV